MTIRKRRSPELSPDGVPSQEWRNRFRISAKIPDQYADFEAYRHKHGFSQSRALQTILDFFFSKTKS